MFKSGIPPTIELGWFILIGWNIWLTYKVLKLKDDKRGQ